MTTPGIGATVRFALGGLGTGILSAGLWGLGGTGDDLGRMVCNETHCTDVGGLYQAAVLVGILLLGVTLLAGGHRGRPHRTRRGRAPLARQATAAARRG